MTIIPKEIQEFIPGKMAWVATADPSGRLNVAPKGTIQVIDDQTLLYADIFPKKTSGNLEKNPQIAIGVVDGGKGYQFKGKAEILNGGPVYDQVKAALAEKAPGLPVPKCVVKIAVEEVYSLTPGPEAGAKIA